MGEISPDNNPFRAYPARVCGCRFQSGKLRKHLPVGLRSSVQRSVSWRLVWSTGPVSRSLYKLIPSGRDG